MKLDKNEIRVAIFILIPILLLSIIVIFKLGYSVAGSTMDVYLKIGSISSINKGTRVKVKGYTIGRVIKIVPVYKPALHFLAVMRIERSISFYEDCSAVIQNQNIIGDPVIELRNPEKKGELLSDGSVIEGIEYVNLEVILQDVHALLTTLSSTVGVFKEISIESRGNLRVLLTNLSSSVATFNALLASSQKDILAILGSFRDTARAMKQISDALRDDPVQYLRRGVDEEKKK